MKKEITVLYSTTVFIDIPEGISNGILLEADSTRINLPKEVEDTLTLLLKEGLSQISFRDGYIESICDTDEETC
jgi:hypothetical protein